MTRGAWYRSPDWSDSDRETFYDRLERSRSEAARRRYVSEKAFALAEAGGTNQLVGAVELFGLLLTRWPDPLAGATCWSSISECRLRLGAIRMARSRPSGSASARSGPSPEYARSRGPTSFTSSSATSAATFTKRRWFAQEQLASEPAFPRQRFLLHAARAVFLEAAGRIEEPLIADSDGRFVASGTHTPGHGGPVRIDEILPRRPAEYTGRVDGDLLSLTVVMTDSNIVVGTFQMTRGRSPHVIKCL